MEQKLPILFATDQPPQSQEIRQSLAVKQISSAMRHVWQWPHSRQKRRAVFCNGSLGDVSRWISPGTNFWSKGVHSAWKRSKSNRQNLQRVEQHETWQPHPITNLIFFSVFLQSSTLGWDLHRLSSYSWRFFWSDSTLYASATCDSFLWYLELPYMIPHRIQHGTFVWKAKTSWNSMKPKTLLQ